jgi:O-antigen ligase
MKKTKNNFNRIDNAPINWLLTCLFLVTLYFQTNLADPFNSPKSWILFITASWLVGYIVSSKEIIFSNLNLKWFLYILSLFIFGLTFSTLMTDFKYVALFGDTQRRNGFLTYLSLAVILLAAAVFTRTYNIHKFFLVLKLITIITVLYGFMQTTGNDFVDWVNPHNSLIGTQGNPNFASAVMGILGILIFSQILINISGLIHKLFSCILVIILTILILRSNSRQGLFVLILGLAIFLTIWLFSKSKKLGFISLLLGSTLFILAILGMLQIGPLEKFVYKPSVSVRGFYWRAGVEMFKNNPLFGIGIDRYGSYFMQYRELEYPIRYGYEITSSNAHNTFIQFFATGGILLGLTYLFLLFFILMRGVIGLRTLKENDRIALAGMLSAWIAFQAQSLISIDNVGISIWGWLLGGFIVGLSVSNSSDQNETKRIFFIKKNHMNIKRVLISTPVMIAAILLVSLLYRGENNSFKSAFNLTQNDQKALEYFAAAQVRSINTKLIDPKYAIINAQNLIGVGLVDEGIKYLEVIHKNDPRNLDALNVLAQAYESKNKIQEAIKYREKLITLNQWSAPTYLSLAKNYKSQGDVIKCKDTINKLLSFATGVNSKAIVEEAQQVLNT